MDLNEEMKKYMEENKQVFLSEMNKIHERLDKIDNEVEGLKIKLEKINVIKISQLELHLTRPKITLIS